MEDNYFKTIIAENNWCNERNKTLAVKGNYDADVIGNIFVQFQWRNYIWIYGKLFFLPRIKEVSKEKAVAIAARKIRQNSGRTPLDKKDEDNRYQPGHIVNIDIIWLFTRTSFFILGSIVCAIGTATE